MKRTRQKINKNRGLNNTIHPLDSTSLFRTLHPSIAENIFFSSMYGTFSRKDFTLDQKASLNNNNKKKSWEVTFLNRINLEIIIRRKTKKVQIHVY